MAFKIETIKNWLGFGDGNQKGEYYYSQGMTYDRGGIEPGWQMVESTKSSTVSSSSGMGLINWFDERDEGTTVYDWGVDTNGVLFKCAATGDAWARRHIPTGTSHGNGLIVDHSSSSRVLFIQDEYVGTYDGVDWDESFWDLGWSVNVPKPADIYEDWVVVGNSSTVAMLNVTDESRTYNGFNFPPNFVIRALKSGQAGVLVGANYNNRGVLALWDCQSDRSIAPWMWFDSQIRGIAKYKGIWLVSTSREIILTNGHSILKSYQFPDITETYPNIGPYLPSGMVVDGERLFITANESHHNRYKGGVYILNLSTGLWEFCPNSNFNTYNTASLGAMFVNSLHRRLVSFGDTSLTPDQYYIGKLYRNPPVKSYFISPPFGTNSSKKKRAEAVILHLGYALKTDTTYDNPDWKITVSLYNYSRVLWGYAQAKITSAAADEITINENTFQLNTQVGDQITVLEGLNAGQVRYIASMTGQGTNTEKWTLDSAMPYVTEQDMYISVCPFKKVGYKEVGVPEIIDDRLFIPVKNSIMGRKFLVRVDCELDYLSPHFENMSLVYDELDTH